MSIEKSSAGNGIVVATTKPDRLLRHDISDEELDGLCEMNSSHYIEALWAALGVFIGSLPAVFEAIDKSFLADETIPPKNSFASIIE